MKKLITLLSIGAAAMFTLCSCAPAGGNASGANANNAGNMWFIILIYVAIFALLYLFLIRPNSKRKKQEKAMRDNLEIGDEITTIGGIVGRVISIKEDTDSFIMETGPDRTKLLLKRWAISTVDTIKDEPEKAAKDKSTESKKGFFGKSKEKEEKESDK